MERACVGLELFVDCRAFCVRIVVMSANVRDATVGGEHQQVYVT